MTKTETAAELYSGGFNCSQSVLAAFCEDYGLDRETALKLSCGLSGGLRSSEVCGAVSGAVMVVGLKYGQFDAADNASRKDCYSKTVEFLNAFKARHRYIVCRQLLGLDAETREKDGQAHPVKTSCADIVKSAAEILEELGY